MKEYIMKRELIKDILNKTETDQEVTIGGWVRTRRDSKGGFSFIEVNDGSCFANIQVIAEASLENYDSEIEKLFPGSTIHLTGTLVKSPGGKQSLEVKAKKIKVLGFCDPLEYPIGKQRVSFEKLREIAHLRPRTNTFGAVTRVRNSLAFATHKFFQENNFLYINTPIITASDCEGAGEMFRVSTLPPQNPHLDDSGNVDFSKDFFGKKSSLTVSGQLEGETHACALGNIYTFGPTFRAENSNTRRHLAEFWMIEPEMAFADLDDDADLAEKYLKYLFRYVLDNSGEDLDFFNARIEKGLIDKLAKLAESSFERISYTEAIKLLQNSGEKFEYTPEWGADLQSEHERYLTEKCFGTPVIVMNYPKSIKPFYMRVNDDDKTVAAMDVLLPNVGEIIGGSQREERLDILNARINECGNNPDDYWWYCELRKFGTVPHAGFGLGFERIVQFSTGMQNIRDVIPFPRTPNNIEF
jgi:asparaginyl-tRNA synthetase